MSPHRAYPPTDGTYDCRFCGLIYRVGEFSAHSRTEEHIALVRARNGLPNEWRRQRKAKREPGRNRTSPGGTTLAERFWAKVEKTETCWVWRGSLGRRRYGSFYKWPGNVQAHRVAYELVVGPIPEGLTLDHLCRNTQCVNPAHLEPVTMAENIRRASIARTVCPKGHSLTPDVRSHLGRCRQCRRDAARRQRELKKAKAA